MADTTLSHRFPQESAHYCTEDLEPYLKQLTWVVSAPVCCYDPLKPSPVIITTQLNR